MHDTLLTMTNHIIVNPPSFRHGANTLSIHNLEFNTFARLFWKNKITSLSIYWTDGSSYFETKLERPCVLEDLADCPQNDKIGIISVKMNLEDTVEIDSNMKDEIYCVYSDPIDSKSLEDQILNIEESLSTNKQLFTSQVLFSENFVTRMLDE